jgi:hypothetical protein
MKKGSRNGKGKRFVPAKVVFKRMKMLNGME